MIVHTNMNSSAEMVVTTVKASITESPENSRINDASRKMQENIRAFAGTLREFSLPKCPRGVALLRKAEHHARGGVDARVGAEDAAEVSTTKLMTDCGDRRGRRG